MMPNSPGSGKHQAEVAAWQLKHHGTTDRLVTIWRRIFAAADCDPVWLALGFGDRYTSAADVFASFNQSSRVGCVMDSSTWAFLLLAIGVLLFVAEVFIPSGGAITVVAASCLLAAVWCAWTAWWHSNPAMFWTFLGIMLIVTPAAVGGAFTVWQHTPLGRRTILQPPTPDEVAAFTEIEQRLRELVGRLGDTVSPLNPAGIVKIDGDRVQCQSEGMIIDRGCKVRVIGVQGSHVIVRRVAESDAASLVDRESEAGSGRRAGDAGGRLDFDFPAS
jgi:membrane-bound serine protease (ClpP class)